ncbi:MAG: protein involved in polysaccharide export with SLBB domain [Arenicella sp.]|jgi:protein involved in polysaccharide export with SLBB domain
MTNTYNSNTNKGFSQLTLSLVSVLMLIHCTNSHAGADTLQGVEAVASENTANEYQLAPGDKISVHVLGQEDLSVELQVSDTNSIIYPLLGKLSVASLTRSQTEALIHDALKGEYLVNPEVSVTIANYRQIYLQGEVALPGPYGYAPGLSLRRAILNAGGFTEAASKDKIYVVNEFENDAQQRKVNIDYKPTPGDIITVKASFF